MNESPTGTAGEPATTLAWLNEQARVVRAEVDRLRAELAGAPPDTDHVRNELLRAVNEQLVLAALRAESVAAIALKDLAETSAREPAGTGRPARAADVKLLAMVAHELRAPLVPIRAAARLLTRAHGDEALLVRLTMLIESGVGHLSALIEDLLDVTRASTGKLRLERGPVDLTAILRLAAENYRLSMAARQQDLQEDVPPGPLVIYGDAHRLLQIVGNLLENASKFTRPGGHITLSLAMYPHSVTITVRDDGEGMSEEQLAHVFDLFRQGRQGGAADGRGLGIGLAVVRELAEAHGGSVVAVSPGPNLGSEFVVSLPLRAHA
jgi:signal transduction histidine kinase